MVADPAVVGHMHIGHEEARRPDDGAPGSGGAAVDGAVFPDGGIRTDLRPRFLAAILGILRITADQGALTNANSRAETDLLLQCGARPQDAVVANLHAGTDKHPGPDLDPDTQLRAGIDDRRGMDAGCAHRSTTRASISASVASWPST